MNTFDLEGFQFELKPLPVLASTDLLPKVLEIWPAVMAIHAAKESENAVQGMAGLARVFSRARPIIEAFLTVCRMRTTAEGSPSPHFQDMSGVYERLLSRQHLTIMAWMMKCIEAEYSDFLSKARRSPEQPAPATS